MRGRRVFAFWVLLAPASEAPRPMAFPVEAWAQVAPEAEGLDSSRLKAAVAYLEPRSGSDAARELVMVRSGRLLWEGAAPRRSR